MRTFTITNSNGDTITIGDETYGITSVEGTGTTNPTLQEQRAPFQDGTTPIDQLLEPRDIVIQGVINVGGKLTDVYEQRRVMSSLLNPKLGLHDIVYTNDHGSWYIQGIPVGPIFANKNANEGQQRFMLTLHCPDPYWKDTSDTEVVLSSDGAAVEVTITGDVETPILATIEGVCENVGVHESIQKTKIEYISKLYNELIINTGFGQKTVTIDNLNNVEIRTVSPMYSVASDGRIWVAAGESGTILTSLDGVLWSVRDSKLASTVRAVIYADSKWVACGNSGISYSVNGIDWTKTYTVAGSNFINNLQYGDSKFVAVGENGVILTSPDAIAWTPQTSGVTYDIKGIDYAPSLGQWCAVGFGVSTGVALTSSDASTWTEQTTGASGGDEYMQHVRWSVALSQWLIAAGTTANKVFTSNDGTSWTKTNIGGTFYPFPIYVDKWYLFSLNAIYTSTDGTSWSTYVVSGIPYGWAFFDESKRWCAVGQFNGIKISSDAVTWTSTAVNTYNAITAITFDGTYYYISVAGAIYRTTDFITFVSVYANTMEDVFFEESSGVYLSCRNNKTIIKSTNGTSWTVKNIDASTGILKKIAYSSDLDQFCVVGDSGLIFTSDDLGETWTSRTSGTSEHLYFVIYIPEFRAWFACGGGDIILKSFDGITWIIVKSASGIFYFSAMSYSSDTGLFIACSGSGKPFYQSYNGTTWTIGYLNPNNYGYRDMKYFLGNYYACGFGVVSKSSDGITWEDIITSPADAFYRIIYTDSFILSGYNGTIISSSFDVANVIQYTSPETKFFQLQPGLNKLFLRVYDGFATASIIYRNRYIGV